MKTPISPFFSIIIPMYNREAFIERTIISCLSQNFTDFELIIVDDGSTDDSVQIVERYNDARILLICCENNQGRFISRNTGAKAATGEWIIWLDSDDELVNNALTTMKKRIDELPDEVLGLRFMCRLDTGILSPDPPHQNEIWDYEGYIRWIELHNGKLTENLPVVHRKTIETVLYSEDREYTMEYQYHLDFSYRYKVMACNDILRLYHLDANPKKGKPHFRKMTSAATAFANRIESLIICHGEYLKKWAPMTYNILSSGMLTQLLLSGQRVKAWKVFLKDSTLTADSFRPMIILLLGTVSPLLLAYAKTFHESIMWNHIISKVKSSSMNI